jgi:hypothetical protein
VISFLYQINVFKVKRQCLLLTVSSILPILISLFGFNRFLGVIGILSYVVFLFWELLKDRFTSAITPTSVGSHDNEGI